MKIPHLFATMAAICLFLTACSSRGDTVFSSHPALALSSQSEAEDKSTYSFATLPGVEIPQIEPEKIFFYDAAMGEEWIITNSGQISQILDTLYTLQIYNSIEKANPLTADLTYGCLYWLEFYESEDDISPAFCLGIDSFFISKGTEKWGPYQVQNQDAVLEELLDLLTSPLLST